MKRFILPVLILMTLNPGIAEAQRIKYKDLVPMLDSARDDEAIHMLIELLQIERDNPNANFRLGLLYAKKYKSTDPLKDFEKAMEYANRTKLQLIKSKTIIDNREVNRNREWYAPVATEVSGSRVEFESIQQQIDKEYNLADSFVTDMPPAYQNFTKSVISYDKAKKIYASLAERYTSLKELFLLYNPNLELQLKQLQQQFDSTLIYFEKYRNLKTGTIIQYDQELEIRPVNVYRKDGLAIQTDFFAPKIQIWNYRLWAENVMQEVNSDIADLRVSLQSNYKEILRNVEAVRTGNELEHFVKIDKQLIFNLGRLDYQTALIPMLQYNQFQQEYLTRKNELSGLESDTSINAQTKLQLYTQLLYESIKADSLLSDLIDKSKDETRLLRHKDFIIENFGDVAGFRKTAQEEMVKTNNEYKNYVNLIKQEVKNISKTEEMADKTVRYQRMNIPLNVTENPLNDLQDNQPVTCQREQNPDGSVYLAGIRRNAQTKQIETYVCKVDPKGTVSWLKFYSIQFDASKILASHVPTALRATQRGVMIAVKSERLDSAVYKNNLIYYSDRGEEILSVSVEQQGAGRFINYQENSRSFVVTYYEEEKTEGVLEVINVTDTGTLIWNKKAILTGTINQVINVQDGVLLAGTATQWQSDKTTLKKNQPALFIARINLIGEIVGEKMIEGFRLEKAHKVNDNNISLMSSMGTAEGPPGSTDFIITNSALEMIYPRKD